MHSETSLLAGVSRKEAIRELDRVDSEQSLRRFIQCAWHLLEPRSRPFVSGWHVDAICEHLEAVTRGEIIRLLINIPPGCMKSMTTSVFWPAWEWGPQNKPSTRYVCASYSDSLTLRDNRRCRNIIRSDWYQSLWGNRYQLVEDQNAKRRYETDHNGFKIATSVGGLGTGERGDRFIIDDPHNIKEGESDAKRDATLQWFEEVVPTRVSDPEKSAFVIIMQRVHERDVSGLVEANELGYTVLKLPMEFEKENRCSTSIGFTDPRKEEGDLLWSERMPREVVERDKKVMGSYAVAGQFQQRPSPRGGGMFNRDWFEVVEYAPPLIHEVRAWDLAASETERAAWTSGLRLGKSSDNRYYITHIKRLRGLPGKVEKAMKTTAELDGEDVEISIPQDPGQAGKSQVAYLVGQLAPFVVRASVESGSKETRAEPVSAQAEVGNIKIVAGPWVEPFLKELEVFPRGEFKDQVDSLSRAFHHLAKKKVRPRRTAAPEVVKVNA